MPANWLSIENYFKAASEMLRLEHLAKHCANIQLPYFGAHISRARNLKPVSAGKRLVASTPEDRLQQAQRAIEALSSMEQQQQTPVSAAVSGKQSSQRCLVQ